MKPLDGVRIVSIEQFAAGPYGTMLLAGMGAEVIRVENASAGGDPARQTGPYLLGDADSQYFQTWNLNKRSVCLDLKSPEGRHAFEALAAKADAVVNNLRGDQPAKLGLDYARLGSIKPNLVCAHISAYGRDNTRAAWPGYDYLMQAETGLMSLTGDPDSPPVRAGAPSPIDYATGMTAMVGLLGALIGAMRTGKGCDVDICLFDVATHQLGYVATWGLNEETTVERQSRSGHLSLAPVQTFMTADGWLFIMCMTDKFWGVLLDVLDRPDLGADPRFATPAARFDHRDDLTQVLDEIFRAASTDHWIAALSGRLPVAPVLSVRQALDNPFLAEARLVQTAPHPINPNLKVLASPIKINGERSAATVCPALGADNASLLGRSFAGDKLARRG